MVLNTVILSVVMLSAVMLSVVMLNVVMLNVVAPPPEKKKTLPIFENCHTENGPFPRKFNLSKNRLKVKKRVMMKKFEEKHYDCLHCLRNIIITTFVSICDVGFSVKFEHGNFRKVQTLSTFM
jgi:hypothetical protein